MADIFSRKKRSQVMSLIRSKNTKPEFALRKLVSAALYPQGYRYKINYKRLPGKPDIAFISQKIAIFADGDFWHGYTFQKIKGRLPRKYWHAKIKGNIERDKKTNRTLKRNGWKVIRIWDHDIRKNPDKVLKKITAAVLE
jgi:DNA mismatch endonuclease (patch repair protein)